MHEDPIARFRALLERARKAGEAQRGTAMMLATCSAEGRPTARMVLLKVVDDSGFVFYTNFESRKGVQLGANPHAALTFYWPSLNVQVRVEGPVARVEDTEADAYFATRERQSQLGAWASKQSEPLPSRRELIGRYLQEKAKRLGRPIPRPPFWGGYRLAPERIEFWISRLGRLHDRIVYRRQGDGWTHGLLYP